MTTRRIPTALAAFAAATLLAGCGTSDAKDAVSGAKDNASAAVSDAKAEADKVAANVAAVKALAKADKKLAAHPDEVLAAARQTCAFMATHKGEAARVEEVRQRFDRVGATSLEAAKAKVIVKILNDQVCPRLK